MTRRFGISLIVAIVVACGMAAPVRGGGWATVTLERPIGEPRAGEAVVVSFLVKQHGVTPIHTAYGEPMRPLLVARQIKSGEQVRAVARPADVIGVFTADVAFPSAGRWSVAITPEPFAATTLDPVVVLNVDGLRAAGAEEEAEITSIAPAALQPALTASAGRRRDAVVALGLVGLLAAGSSFALLRRRGA